MNIKVGPYSISFPLIASVVTVLAIAVMIKLGLWQLSRAEQKELRLQQIEERSQRQNLTLEDIQQLQTNTDIRDYSIQVHGYFDIEKWYLLDNKIHNGQVGYQLIQLFNTSTGRKILVNLGWLPIERSRDILPKPNISTNYQILQGDIWLPSEKQFELKEIALTTGWPQVIQQIKLDELQEHVGEEIAPMILLLDEEHPIPYPRNWQPVVMPPEKHYGYAIQWFGLALACLIIFLFANKTKEEE